MKKDVCKALFTLLLAPLFLSGCWQEPAAPDTSQLLTEELGGGKQEQPDVYKRQALRFAGALV